MRFLSILIAALLLAMPAAAQENDCAVGVGGELRAMWGGLRTVWVLGAEDAKARTDVARLLRAMAPLDGGVAKPSLLSAALVVANCAALEQADTTAAQLRVQLADVIGEPVRKVTANSVQAFLRERLADGTPGQAALLAPTEQEVLRGVLCFAASRKPAFAGPVSDLLADLRWPACNS